MNLLISLVGASHQPYSKSLGLWVWILISLVCFIVGVLLWWPIGVLGIIVLMVSEHRIQAYTLGALLDVTYQIPSISLYHRDIENVFGFPFLGLAIFASIILYLYKRMTRGRMSPYILQKQIDR